MSRLKAPPFLTDQRLSGELWFAADLHLSAQTPRTNAAFLAFLEQAASTADALFLPGDIFDVWIGDDLATRNPPAWLAPILHGLAATSKKTRLYLGRGNRDFLMGQALARLVGGHLLPERIRLHTDYGCVLLSHGDEYCTDDKAFQRFRRVVHQPVIQKIFLSLPLSWRRRVAAWARNRRQATNQSKSMQIMDVAPATIQQAFKTADCRLMIHGHTHRPALHKHSINGQSCQRFVLPDWDCDTPGDVRGGWLALNEAGVVMQDLVSQEGVQPAPLQYGDP